MHLFKRYTRQLPALVALACLPFSATIASASESFEVPSQIRLEASTLIQLLQQYHYNRDSVSAANYAEVIPEFMAGLDGQHLFFLEQDKEEFTKRYEPESLYWTIASMGKIEPAYEIFSLYKKRASERVAWVQETLKKGLDLTTDDSYVIDRGKAAWPKTVEEADQIWSQRLRFELIKELLNKKTEEEASKIVGKRYERLLKNMSEMESADISELFLASIARLYDPHSTYFSADTYADFGIQMRLQLVGIGALLSIEEDQCVIKDIIPGGPAFLDNQLKKNDKIIAVAQDGAEPVEVIGMKLRKIVDMIRGEKGTRVRLIVEPAEGVGSVTRKEITLTRNVVNLDSSRAHAAIFEVPDAEGNLSPIGVITLPTFYGPDVSSDGKAQNSATKDIEELIRRLKTANIKGLVLDLRRNGGGLLSEAISLTGLFIKSGPVVQVRSYAGEIKVDDDEDASVAYDGPLTVLVSRLSASASEIVAGALQNYGRAVVVGDSSTHGKGTVQTVLELRNLNPFLASNDAKSGATKLTVQKFYLPNGASTQRKGVVPDIILPSFEDHLPIGESDLPHALAWDQIPSSRFDGKPLPIAKLSPLTTASARRQEELPEFAHYRRAIDWFKTRQEQKSVSLNLERRKEQKEKDEAFKKEIKEERKRLAASGYKFEEILLTPPPPPREKIPQRDDDGSLEDEEALREGENERYSPADIPLREALRIVKDLIRSPSVAPAASTENKKVAVTAPSGS